MNKSMETKNRRFNVEDSKWITKINKRIDELNKQIAILELEKNVLYKLKNNESESE